MPARWREPIQPTLILIFILTLLLSVLEQICALNDCRYRFFYSTIGFFFRVCRYMVMKIESGSHRNAANVKWFASFTQIFQLQSSHFILNCCLIRRIITFAFLKEYLKIIRWYYQLPRKNLNNNSKYFNFEQYIDIWPEVAIYATSC